MLKLLMNDIGFCRLAAGGVSQIITVQEKVKSVG